MPRPRLIRKVLDLSLSSGLSQAEDERWVSPGQAITANNVAKVNASTLGKTTGFTALNTNTLLAGFPNAITRLLTHNQQLLMVSTGSSNEPNTLWAYDENGSTGVADPTFAVDRMPDSYITPGTTVLGQGKPIVETDGLVYVDPSGFSYALHIGLMDDGLQYNQTGTLYYSVTNPVTGSFAVTPRAIAGLPTYARSPKVILCQSTAVLTYSLLRFGYLQFFAISLDMTSPQSGWVGNTQIAGCSGVSGSGYNISPVDDAGAGFAFIYADVANQAVGPDIVAVSVSGFGVLAHGTLTDASWSGHTILMTGCTIRAVNAEAAAYVAYSFADPASTSTVPVARVQGGAINWPSCSGAFATPVDLTSGASLTRSYPAPQVMDIKSCGTVGGHAQSQMVVWSTACSQNFTARQTVRVGYNPAITPTPSNALPQAAIFNSSWYPSAGAAVKHANNPRWTNGVVLASGMAVTQTGVNGMRSQVIGWIPSSNPEQTATEVQSVAIVRGSPSIGSSSAPLSSSAPPQLFIVAASGDPGVGAAGIVTIDDSTGEVTGAQLSSGGYGYSTSPSALVVMGQSFHVANGAITTDASGAIQSIVTTDVTKYTAGENYNPGTQVVPLITPPVSGNPLEVGFSGFGNVDPTTGAITSVSVVNGGTHYLSGFATIVAQYNDPIGITASAEVFTNPYSNIQGTYYLFEIDTFQDVQSVNDVSNNVPMRLIGSFATRLAQSPTLLTATTLPHLYQGNGQYTADLAVADNPAFSSVQTCSYTLTSEQNQQPAELGGLSGMSGGQPVVTDGCHVSEFAFPYSPENINAYVNTLSGGVPTPGTLTPGQYQYISIYSRKDAAGNVHRSGRSVPVTVNVGLPTYNVISAQNDGSGYIQLTYTANPYTNYVLSTADTVYVTVQVGGLLNSDGTPFVGGKWLLSNATANTVTLNSSSWGSVSGGTFAATIEVVTSGITYDSTLYIPTMGFSLSQRGQVHADAAQGINPSEGVVTVEVYRTVSGGTIFYNIANDAIGSKQTTNAKQLNSVFSPYVIVTDNVSDTDLQQNALLYGDGSNGATPGAILDNLFPPALQGLIIHKNRWWGFNGAAVWYSKALTTGEGPGFNEQFAFTVDDGDNPITALASMDERLIIFKGDRIFYVSGDGPADNGTQNDLQPPQRIASDVGAIDWRSIVVTPSGCWFNSEAGLYQLSRKYDVVPSGTFVGDTLAEAPDITSAQLDAANSVVTWTANTIDPNFVISGVIIRYSWVYDAWTTQTLKPTDPFNLPLQSACLSGPNNLLTITDGSNGIYRNSLTSYFNSSNYQPITWESYWVKTAGIEGWGRWWMINLVWKSMDPSLVTVQVAYNYSETYTDTWTVSATAQANVLTPLVQWSFQPSQPHAEAIRIKITDSKDGTVAPTTGQGPTIIGVTVEYGTAEPSFRGPTKQRGSA